jgi:hypothetical protein
VRKRRNRFPYYKLQSYSERQCSWVDDRKEAFDSLDDVQAYIGEQPRGRQLRIVIVQERSRRVLQIY